MSMKTKSKEAVDLTPRAQNNEWKTKHSTEELKKFLNDNERLSFIIDGMKIIVMPKTEGNYHMVFVNGVEQRNIPFNSEDYKKWFKDKISQEEINLQNDWRYLLSLNMPELSPTNVLWEYFENHIPCSERIEFTPFPDEHPDFKIKARTLFEAEHFGEMILSARRDLEENMKNAIALENKAKNTIKQVFKKSKLEKKRIKKNKNKRKRLEKLELHRISCIKHTEKQSKFRIVCLKHIPTNSIERIPQYKAEKIANRDNGNYQIVAKFEWKRYIRQIKNNKSYNDGLHVITSSGFPYEKSQYSGIRRKDRRFKQRGRTYNPLIKKVFVPTVYEKEKVGEDAEKNPIFKIVKEKSKYNSFYIEPIWKEIEIKFYKYAKDPITGSRTNIKTDEIWTTINIWKKVGYKKVPIEIETQTPIVKHYKRTLYLHISKYAKKDIEDIKLHDGEKLVTKRKKSNYKILDNGMILYNNKKYHETKI